MEYRTLGDPEFCIMVEEEKRLCEKDTEFIKGILKKGIGEKDGKLVDKDTYSPSIKINRKLDHKELYKNTLSESLWKLMTDIKGSKRLVAFLEIKFPKTNAPELHFCFDMDIRLYRAGEERIFKIGDKEYKAAPYKFEKGTDTILQWMELLVKTEDINIFDEEDPSVGIEGIPVDIPKTILGLFGEFVKRGGKIGEKEPVLILRDKDSMKSDFI
jgi:hypothetical protein